MSFRSGLGSRVSGLGSRVSGLGSRVSGLGSRVSGLGSRVPGLGSRVSGLGSRSGTLVRMVDEQPTGKVPLGPQHHSSVNNYENITVRVPGSVVANEASGSGFHHGDTKNTENTLWS